MRLLREGGLLNPVWLDKSVKSSALQSRAHLNQAAVPIDPSAVPDMPPEGVATAMQFQNYYETIMHVRPWPDAMTLDATPVTQLTADLGMGVWKTPHRQLTAQQAVQWTICVEVAYVESLCISCTLC
jgi:hypothetical protein